MCVVIGAYRAGWFWFCQLCSFSSPALEFTQLETEKRRHKVFEIKGGSACMTGSYPTMP
jgi:hypothetical protein